MRRRAATGVDGTRGVGFSSSCRLSFFILVPPLLRRHEDFLVLARRGRFSPPIVLKSSP